MALGTPSRASGSGTPLSHAMRMLQSSSASVVMAQPVGAHVGAYGGSFASPPTRASGSLQQPGTPNSSRTSLAMPQSVLVPRLRSQSSSANLTVPPPAQVLTAMPAHRSSASAMPVAYPAAFASSPMVTLEGLASAGGHMVDGVPAEEVLLRTRLVGGGDELAKAEAESLRRSVAAQEERILQLTKDLKESHENERKLGVELEASRDEVARLAEELRLERAAREQAETQLLEARMAAEVASQRAASQERHLAANREKTAGSRRTNMERGSPQRGAFASRRAPAERSTPLRGRETGLDERWPPATKPSSSNGDNASSHRGTRQPHSAKDEIDGRLYEFLDRADHDLVFRRLNRGWYSFRNEGDRGPASHDRSVEISIVNGKLMARLEPSTHDPGWNNGKLGAIERFVAAMSQI
mmetsp:Transcript_99708/g.155882  ORF Transcript_99708/g.155882 Transcript_99708/m.155882 type:complete len:412 (-) Transcript_99708:104-1339(-)